MKVRLILLVLLPAVAGVGGCAHKTIKPMPGTMLSVGMLLRTERVPLSERVELRRYELLKSNLGNEFYPFNVSRAEHADRLVSKLFRLDGQAWRFVDFASMPRAKAHQAANFSPCGRGIVYERPDVAAQEGDWPRKYPRDRRTRRVAILHADTGRRFILDYLTELYGLGQSSYWRGDAEELAFTTTCAKNDAQVRQLVVMDACGQVRLDAGTMKPLEGLEFIAYSPDGKRIAALRPTEPGAGGRKGGTLVEVDLARRTTRDVGSIPGVLASQCCDRFEVLIDWDREGRCRLKRPNGRE